MSTTFLISYFVLWGLFLLQSVVILLLLRQVGVLHLRLRPSGARIMGAGPEIGQPVPPVMLEDMDDPAKRLEISRQMETAVLLLFVTPSCAVCSSLIPTLKPLVHESKGELGWAMVAFGSRKSSRSFRQKHGLNYLLFAYGPEIRERYKVGLAPYGILIRKDGIAISKGLINHMEHLESLLEVRDQTAMEVENRRLTKVISSKIPQ